MSNKVLIPDNEVWAWGGERPQPSLARLEVGNESGIGAAPPEHTDHNFQMWRGDQNIQAILREGITEYDANEVYEPNAIIKQANGVVGRSDAGGQGATINDFFPTQNRANVFTAQNTFRNNVLVDPSSTAYVAMRVIRENTSGFNRGSGLSVSPTGEAQWEASGGSSTQIVSLNPDSGTVTLPSNLNFSGTLTTGGTVNGGSFVSSTGSFTGSSASNPVALAHPAQATRHRIALQDDGRTLIGSRQVGTQYYIGLRPQGWDTTSGEWKIYSDATSNTFLSFNNATGIGIISRDGTNQGLRMEGLNTSLSPQEGGEVWIRPNGMNSATNQTRFLSSGGVQMPTNLTLSGTYHAKGAGASLNFSPSAGVNGTPAFLRQMREQTASTIMWEAISGGTLRYSTGAGDANDDFRVELDANSGQVRARTITAGFGGVEAQFYRSGSDVAALRFTTDGQTILSANDNNIFLRPGGRTSTSQQVTINSSGMTVASNITASGGNISATGTITSDTNIGANGFIRAGGQFYCGDGATTGNRIVHIPSGGSNTPFEWGNTVRTNIFATTVQTRGGVNARQDVIAYSTSVPSGEVTEAFQERTNQINEWTGEEGVDVYKALAKMIDVIEAQQEQINALEARVTALEA